MTGSKSTRFADKAAHIIGTYGLPLPCVVVDALRRDMRDSNPVAGKRLAEEEAALFLARNLHAMAITELRSGSGSRTAGGVLGAWSKYTQQVMYRADLGLVNMVVFRDEILPLIDDMEQMLRQESPAGECSQTRIAARTRGVTR